MNSELTLLPVGQIGLDTSNPRIQRALSMYEGEPTAERIALALKEGSSEQANSGTTFDRLRSSIVKNRGIISPIIVNQRGKEFICIEGNTRLLIYRELYEGTGEENWKDIICLVYRDASDEVIDAIRLQAHLIGPRQWDPYSKGKYLDYLWNVEYLSHDQIIEYCGGNKQQIDQSIAAYRMVEEVYKPLLPSPEEFKHNIFSGFVEYQDTKVHQAVYESGFTDKNFCMWLHTKKIKRLEDVRALPSILRSEKAKEAFLDVDSKAAISILNQPSLYDTVVDSDIVDVLRALQHKISHFEIEDIEILKENFDTLSPVVEETVSQLIDLKDWINSA